MAGVRRMDSYKQECRAVGTRSVRKPSSWRSVTLLSFSAIAIVLAGCAASPEQSPKKKQTKEYFPESKYGVKASPRVANSAGKPLPRGGGRHQIGKPYQVKGKWYYPKEKKKDYTVVGKASWYGSAFHGRLTANGEIYDKEHLTAAHPTMPLPSYARVTNTENGSSVIVRVNDRGPFERGRVIDLSKKAAELLDYKHSGVAQVKVEYVGRAPLDGNDDAFLLASYNPGGSDPVGLPASGVMLAMNAPVPSSPALAAMPVNPPVSANSPFASYPTDGQATEENPVLPASVPVPFDRPGSFGIADAGHITGLTGYAEDRIAMADDWTKQVYSNILNESAMSALWKRRMAEEQREYVELGLFSSLSAFTRLEQGLPSFARVKRVKIPTVDGELYELSAYAENHSNDELLKAAWNAGATDAFVVRMD